MKTKIMIAIFALSITTAIAESPSPTPQPDKLKDALAQMITGVTQTAGQAKDFIVSQLPDVVKQLLMWKMAESIWQMFLPAIVLIVAVRICSKYRAKGREKDWKYIAENEEADALKQIIPFALLHAWMGAMAIWFCLSANITWLQIWIAPKVYLIEYAKTLVK